MQSRPRITFPMSCEPRGSLACLDADTPTPKCEHEDVFFMSSIHAPPADIKPDNYHLRLQEQLAPLKASSFSNAPLKAEPTEAIIPEERPRFTVSCAYACVAALGSPPSVPFQSGDRVIVRVTTNDEGRWVHGVVVDLSWFRARPTVCTTLFSIGCGLLILPCRRTGASHTLSNIETGLPLSGGSTPTRGRCFATPSPWTCNGLC